MPPPQAQELPHPPKQTSIYRDTERFKIESHGSFQGGYGNHEREIFILKDIKTNKEYLVITGAGATELWQETTTKIDANNNPTTETTTIEE